MLLAYTVVGERAVLVAKPGATNLRHRLVAELADGRVVAVQGGDDAVADADLTAFVADVLAPAA